MIRFLFRYPWLVADKYVIFNNLRRAAISKYFIYPLNHFFILVAAHRIVLELGCGVGACGLMLASSAAAASTSPPPPPPLDPPLPKRIILTDGQESTLALTRANVHSLSCWTQGDGKTDSGRWEQSRRQRSRISVHKLLWEDITHCRTFLQEEGLAGKGVDVVIANELMYYNVKADAVLKTATWLLMPGSEEREEGRAKNGLILLAHIFRAAHLPQALSDAAAVSTMCRLMFFFFNCPYCYCPPCPPGYYHMRNVLFILLNLCYLCVLLLSTSIQLGP